MLFWQAYVTKTMGWGKKDYKQNQKTEMEPKTHHVIILVHFCSHWLVALAIYRDFCVIAWSKRKRKEKKAECFVYQKEMEEMNLPHSMVRSRRWQVVAFTVSPWSNLLSCKKLKDSLGLK